MMNLQNIPSELAELDQWVNWKLEKLKGRKKEDKIPHQPNNELASSTNKKTWHTLKDVVAKSKNFNGIGFVFGKDDNYVGMDLDGCIVDGVIEDWALGIINRISSYTEISQGGTGIHIIFKGKIPDNSGNRRGKIEVYDHARFFTMTTNVYNNLKEIREFQELPQFLEENGFITEEKPATTQSPPSESPILTNDQVIKKASKAKNGDKFKRLMNGDITDYPSQSEADLGFVSMLGFWTQNIDQIVSILQLTPLWDEKWERKDYQRRTIGKVLSTLGETYKITADKQPQKSAEEKAEAIQEKPATIHNPNDPKMHFAVIDEIILRRNDPKNALKECEFYAKSITIPNVAGKVWNYALSKLGYSGTQAKIELVVKNAKDLKHTEMPEINWIIPGYLPEGLTLLCGKPKMGKSWLALSVAVSVSSGGMAFGKISLEERIGKVLYLALEDNERRMKKRLSSLCQNDEFPENLYYSTVWDKGENGVNALRTWIEDNRDDVRLVVIDTLVSFRAKSNGKSNNEYDKDSGDLEPLQVLAGEFGIGIVVIHHLRKATSIDDDFDTISGTLGLTGKADTNIIFTRARGEADAVLKGTGRDFDEDFEIAMKMDSVAGWAMIGDAQDYQMGKSRQAIYDVLKESTAPVSAKDITEMLGKNASTTRSILSKMVSEGIIKNNKGKYLLI